MLFLAGASLPQERIHQFIVTDTNRLTTSPTLGLVPMAIGFGEGAEVRTPMAITVIGGLLVSTMLTLIVIPVVYSLLDRKKFVGKANADLPFADPAAV